MPTPTQCNPKPDATPSAVKPPCRIRVLPPRLVNKIAAGEVVERPASVVKELLDNAIDAGASRIAVTIAEGGKTLIRVTDDGGGMTADELGLAVVAHATSKLRSDDDLYSISSMGFRGEALASIGAVAKLSLTSRLGLVPEGYGIRASGERIEPVRAVGCPPGTAVEVRDLFFNVPARRRFLKSASTEFGHIKEQVVRAALARPDIGFELTHHDRRTLNLTAGESRRDRIARLYGAELASELLEITRDERGLVIEAYLAPPARSRASAQWQYSYINGRYIRDRFLQHAIKEAHRGLMEHNRHGVVFVFLSLAPEQVDVNVHPTKIEVRWADGNLIHSQVLSALRETFQQADLTPTFNTNRGASASRPSTVSDEEADRMRRELAAVLKSASPESRSWGPSGAGSGGMDAASCRSDSRSTLGPSSHDRVPESLADATAPWRLLYGDRSVRGDDAVAESAGEGMVPPHSPVPGARSKAIQMHNLYLVAETDDGILIIDQHALHERVMYEQFRESLTKGPLESQRLLLPETINASGSQLALLTQHADLLARLGIEAVPFGPDTVAIQSFPTLMKDASVASFMGDLLDLLADQPAASPEIVIHKVLDMMACKAAVKAGDALSSEEIEALMAKRHLIDKASNCPHGRPTTLRLSKADLNRQFKRT